MFPMRVVELIVHHDVGTPIRQLMMVSIPIETTYYCSISIKCSQGVTRDGIVFTPFSVQNLKTAVTGLEVFIPENDPKNVAGRAGSKKSPRHGAAPPLPKFSYKAIIKIQDYQVFSLSLILRNFWARKLIFTRSGDFGWEGVQWAGVTDDISELVPSQRVSYIASLLWPTRADISTHQRVYVPTGDIRSTGHQVRFSARFAGDRNKSTCLMSMGSGFFSGVILLAFFTSATDATLPSARVTVISGFLRQ
ncbi:hypothetical protein C8J57DRAFT_1250269 [Mycena rebaudengoi]|nr:hypothetical protein C8J57DRAFT_1250269 [Mycena rebaudengoi]